MIDEKNKAINEYLTQIRKTHDAVYVEMLYDTVNTTVRHIGLKYLHNEELTDDFVQDFWADIFKIADGFVFSSYGHAYVCKVATNRAISAYRRIKRENAKIAYVDYGREDISFLYDGDQELKQLIESAMGSLSDDERLIIQSAFFEDKTIREIARDMKWSKSKVGRLKLMAMEKLKCFLENEDERS